MSEKEKKSKNANENLGLNPSHNGETDEEKIAKILQPIFQIYSSRIFMEIVILKVKYKRDDNWFSYE